MRPEILNPLFAEVAALKGVGPALAKPLERLKLSRVVDVAFHLPTGWVDRLRRDEIPLAARVFAVADALDAITSDRPYRAARSWDEAFAEILSERGRQFDPDVVDAFREREGDLRAIRRGLAAA